MRAENPKSGMKSAVAVRVLTLLAVLRQANSVKCRDNLTLQHCREDPDGVHGLDCFGRKTVTSQEYLCTWEPGRGPSRKTYTLIIKQKRKTDTCKSYSNIASNFTNIRVFAELMNVELFEHDNSSVCTKAVFQGLPPDLVRCGPPESVSFRRAAGRMAVNASWRTAYEEAMKHFEVRYRALPGNWSQVTSDNKTRATVGAVNASLAYSLQLRCQKNTECTQCLWGHEYHVFPELTAAPDFGDVQDEDVAAAPGHRRISLTWKFNSKSTHDGYQVSIGKASGEAPREAFRTTEPRITFVLSYSSYRLEVGAFNRDSTSPALLHTIARRENQLGSGAERPNVTVESNRSFHISWVAGPYICYSAEWTRRGREAAFKSFCSRDNYKKVILKDTQEALEPYRKYTLTLHGWTDRKTYDSMWVNNSERTYGSTHFYFLEGAPVVAPENFTIEDEMPDSAVLRWLSIPEEKAQGFLLGYVIYYTEYQKGAEKNVTVNPDVNSHMLEGLKSRTLYEVQISGFTRAGVGVRSKAVPFTTDDHEKLSFDGHLKYAALLTTLLLFLPPILARAKRFLWPSIPDPKKSNVMQKMEMTNELEPLQSISTLRVEEWDTDSLRIVQKEQAAAAAACISTESPSLLDGSEDEFGDVRETRLDAAAAACISTESPSLLDGSEDEFGDVRETRHDGAAPLATVRGYTTVEMFRQAVAASSQEREPDVTVPRPQLDYVRQFSIDSTRDNQALQ